jgi:hypothetical protein
LVNFKVAKVLIVSRKIGGPTDVLSAILQQGGTKFWRAVASRPSAAEGFELIGICFLRARLYWALRG